MPKRQVSQRSKLRRKILRYTRRLAKWCVHPQQYYKRELDLDLDLFQVLEVEIERLKAWEEEFRDYPPVKTRFKNVE